VVCIQDGQHCYAATHVLSHHMSCTALLASASIMLKTRNRLVLLVVAGS
jgi:hypothetical protein